VSIPSTPKSTPLVAVIDDDPSVQRVLTRLLRFNGFATCVAASLAELTKVMASSPAIESFVVDLGLKGRETGFDVLNWVRAQPQYAQTPILVLTGNTRLSEEEQQTIRAHRAYIYYKGQSLHPAMEYLKRLLSSGQP
jgi:CheY-like chemotaxis protein